MTEGMGCQEGIDFFFPDVSDNRNLFGGNQTCKTIRFGRYPWPEAGLQSAEVSLTTFPARSLASACTFPIRSVSYSHQRSFTCTASPSSGTDPSSVKTDRSAHRDLDRINTGLNSMAGTPVGRARHLISSTITYPTVTSALDGIFTACAPSTYSHQFSYCGSFPRIAS